MSVEVNDWVTRPGGGAKAAAHYAKTHKLSELHDQVIGFERGYVQAMDEIRIAQGNALALKLLNGLEELERQGLMDVFRVIAADEIKRVMELLK